MRAEAVHVKYRRREYDECLMNGGHLLLGGLFRDIRGLTDLLNISTKLLDGILWIKSLLFSYSVYTLRILSTQWIITMSFNQNRSVDMASQFVQLPF